ncbi:glycosyltransferase family 39 protein [Rosistilla ulvae]|uniref:glycosyltransferase family 39 protein n=1 Tax=Rosistilla ulvae TaxID=1930277 RepID=UPI001C54DE83|nr:glycosyltransferase family 39 protein [Rosistilla ulvae]
MAVLQRYKKQLALGLNLLTKQLRNDGHRLLRRSGIFLRQHRAALLVLMFVAAMFRLPYVSQPMRYDEAHTYIQYASKPAALIVTRYDEPNNHVFHSLLVHATTNLLGDQPAIVRLPALVSGILLVGLTYCLGTVCCGVQTGRIAALLVAGMPQLIFYSTNARGYTTTAALFLLACLSAHEAIARRNAVAWALLSITLSLSTWTVPTMVYGMIGIFAWLCGRSIVAETKDWRILFGIGLATIATVGLLYAPIALSIGTDRLLSIGGSHPVTFGSFVSSVPEKTMGLYHWITWSVPIWAQLILFGSAVLAIARCSKVPWPVGAAVVLVSLTMLLQRVFPPERTWCFALPLLAILCAHGIVRLFGWFPKDKWFKDPSQYLAVGIVAGIAFSLVTSDAIRKSDETGLFFEADEIVSTLSAIASPTEPIIAVTPASATIHYYARNGRLPGAHFMPPTAEKFDNTSAIVVSSRAHGQSIEDVLHELQLDALYDAKSSSRVAEFETADLYRVTAK